MSEKEAMVIVMNVLNVIAIFLIVGKLRNIEKGEESMLYDLLNLMYPLAYNAVGFCIGTLLAYLVKHT